MQLPSCKLGFLTTPFIQTRDVTCDDQLRLHFTAQGQQACSAEFAVSFCKLELGSHVRERLGLMMSAESPGRIRALTSFCQDVSRPRAESELEVRSGSRSSNQDGLWFSKNHDHRIEMDCGVAKITNCGLARIAPRHRIKMD
eukprot:2403110-Rhodomonas_salina.1